MTRKESELSHLGARVPHHGNVRLNSHSQKLASQAITPWTMWNLIDPNWTSSLRESGKVTFQTVCVG
jgi:hypothetical protein